MARLCLSRVVVLRAVAIYRGPMPLLYQYALGALVICGLVAAGVGRECGRGVLDSFVYGFVLGPFGVLLIPLLAIAKSSGGVSVQAPVSDRQSAN